MLFEDLTTNIMVIIAILLVPVIVYLGMIQNKVTEYN